MMSLLLAVAIPVGLGSLTGLATRSAVRGAWYASLVQPSWAPPRWLFGPVWTLLYALMGVASWLVWRADGPLGLYALQLLLNMAWSLIFFNLKSLRWAMADVVVLLAAVLATTAAFFEVDPTAGWLMVPYAGWTAFATVLTAALLRLNA